MPPPSRTVAALLVLCCLSYAGTVGHELCHDDLNVVASNRLVRTPGLPLREIFASSYLAGVGRDDNSYRPLAILSFAVVEELAPGAAWAQHLANVVLHAAVVLLLFAIATPVVGRRIAVGAAALFAVHPAHTEAVAYVTGRSEILALGFGLASAWAMRASRPLASSCLLLLALLSKETALTYPVLLAMAVVAFAPGRRGHALWPLAALAVYLAVRTVVVGGLVLPDEGSRTFVTNPIASLPWQERLVPALGLQGRYLLALAAPLRLAIDHSYAAIDPAGGGWGAGVTITLGAVVGALCLLRVDRVLGAVAVAGLLTFVPFNNLVLPGGTIYAERLLYTPSAFFCTLVAAGLLALGSRRGSAALAVVIVLFTVRTVVRNRDWRDDFSIFRAAYEDGSADSVIVLHNYAYHLYTDPEHVDLDRALALLERADHLYPAFGAPRITIAAIHLKRGDLAEARKAIADCLIRYPDDAASHRLQAELLYRHLGRRTEALPYIERSLQLDPDQPLLRAWRGRSSSP